MAETPRPAEHTSSLKIYFRLLGYVKPYVGIFLLSIVGFVIFASTQPMLAGILKYFVDGLSNPEAVLFPNVPYLRDLQLLQAVPLLIILIAAWQGLGSFLGNYFLAKVSLCLVHDLRVELFNKLLVLPNRYFDNHNSGHLISRITFNVTMVTGAATDAIKVVIREGLTVVFLFAYLLWMNWHLTLVMVAILPVIAVMVSIASKKNSANRARRFRWPWATSPTSRRKPSRVTAWCAASAARPTNSGVSARPARATPTSSCA